MAKGLLIVVSGPSGAGKGTLCQALLARSRNLRFSVSATTRRRRAGEVDGVHYSFWSKSRFLEAVARGHFLEWAEVYGNLYGTPLAEVESARVTGVDTLLDLDIQGVRQVKLNMPDAILILILPPSLATLTERVAQRATESGRRRRLRLRAAADFGRAAQEFEYVVVNDSLEEAVHQLEAIITAERCRVFRQADAVSALAQGRAEG